MVAAANGHGSVIDDAAVVSHDGDHFTEAVDVSATGPLERGAEGQARGHVHSQDGKRVGPPQRHRKAIHRYRNPADAPVAGNPTGIDI